DDPPAERVDEGHVHGRQAPDATHVHAEIEAVGIGRFDEGAQRCGVGGTADQLEKLLVFEAVHDTEETLARSPRRTGFPALGGRSAERSVGVGRVAKVSLTVASGSRSQPSSRTRRKRMFRSARTTGESVNGSAPAARKNSSSVMLERMCGKSTAHTSWSGTPR